MVDPGSLADWVQALVMAAGLGSLAATCAWALREDEKVDRGTRSERAAGVAPSVAARRPG